jgi:hypothetical protein
MAGPIPSYLTVQTAAQTAFTVPFGLLTLVNTSITAATAAGLFNTTVDCSLFVAEDISNLRIYLDSLGYKVEYAKNTGKKSLLIDWGQPLDIDGTAPITGSVTVTNFPAIQAVSQSGPWTVNVDTDEQFDYVTGSLTGAGSIVGVGECHGIRVFAAGVDSRFAISGGSPIMLRANQIFYHIPQGELINPTIDWFSGSIDVWMEVDGETPPPPPGADLGLLLGIAHLG